MAAPTPSPPQRWPWWPSPTPTAWTGHGGSMEHEATSTRSTSGASPSTRRRLLSRRRRLREEGNGPWPCGASGGRRTGWSWKSRADEKRNRIRIRNEFSLINTGRIHPLKTRSASVRRKKQIPSMSSSSAEQISSPPTYRFRPKKRELVEFYLLPRARGQAPFPGVLIEDDAAGSTLPWDLFERHGVGSEDEAYFIVRASEAKRKPGARQDRALDGGVGTWKMQSSVEKRLRVRGGERIRVYVSNLNLHMGRGKNSGSVGWVMHEYSIAAPPCPSLVKICHIAFSGHGRMRRRVPDAQQIRRSSGSSALPCPGNGSLGVACASGDKEPSHLVLIDDGNFRQSPLLGSSGFQVFPSAASEHYTQLEARVPTTEQQQDIVVSHLMGQQSTMPVAQQMSAGELEFWSSIGVDVQSDDSFDQEQSTGVQSSWVVPNTGAMATMVQSSSVVPNTGAMATGVQSSSVVPNNGAMVTGAQSSWVVPNTGAMAIGVQWGAGDLNDFCRSILGNMQTNCAAPDFGNMATGTLGGCCSLLCK